jgi:periplasmic divalent cation tolerance protein
MSIHSVYVTYANLEEAERIGRQMIEERLAACVNILGPCRSIYRWQAAIETADEVAALFKTTEGNLSVLMDRIRQLHSYEVPAIAAWPVADAPKCFVDWVEQSSDYMPG